MVINRKALFLGAFVPLCEPGSVVGIATGYWLDGPGIESRWKRDFPHLSRPALGPTQPLVQWIPGLSRGKERPGRDADPSPPSSTMVKKEYSYTSTSPMGRTACTEPQCLYKDALYLYLLPCHDGGPTKSLCPSVRLCKRNHTSITTGKSWSLMSEIWRGLTVFV